MHPRRASSRIFSQALKWYQKAAEAGDAVGMTDLAVLYSDGKGVTQDPAKALEWFQKSADAGNSDGMAGWA